MQWMSRCVQHVASTFYTLTTPAGRIGTTLTEVEPGRYRRSSAGWPDCRAKAVAPVLCREERSESAVRNPVVKSGDARDPQSQSPVFFHDVVVLRGCRRRGDAGRTVFVNTDGRRDEFCGTMEAVSSEAGRSRRAALRCRRAVFVPVWRTHLWQGPRRSGSRSGPTSFRHNAARSTSSAIITPWPTNNAARPHGLPITCIFLKSRRGCSSPCAARRATFVR